MGVFTSNPSQIRELIGLFFIFISLLIGLSLWSYNISDPTFNQSVSVSTEIQNSAGAFGAYLAGLLTDIFGLAAYVWVFFFLAMGLGFIARWFIVPWHCMLGYIILFICFITLFEAYTFGVGDVEGGGILGAWLYALFHTYFNPIGSAFIWIFLFMIGLELCFHISWATLFSFLLSSSVKRSKTVAKKIPKTLVKALVRDSQSSKGHEILTLDIQVKESKNVTRSGSHDKNQIDVKKNSDSFDSKSKKSKNDKESVKDPLGFSSKPLSLDDYTSYNDWDEDDFDESSLKHSSESKNSKNSAHSAKSDLPAKEEKKRGFWSSVFFSDEDAENLKKTKNSGGIGLPPVDLLSAIPEEEGMPSRASLEAKGETLIQCLLDFNVHGTLAGILPGPVVTMFEIRPERGVKAKRFEMHSKEIAMAIKAIAVRVQAPIPGTDTVGIEVPNDKRQVVSFREIIQSDAFTNSNSVLSLGLGKDIFGKPMCGKMEEMPHLLVAGATGAGKSVCLNSIILSILYKAHPHEVKMLLIDPKRVELAMYADLPHLVHPVVTDMDLAKNALLWAIDEMNQRYMLFEVNKVRNFTEYNNLVKSFKDSQMDDLENDDDENKNHTSHSDSKNAKQSTHALNDENAKKLPFIVIIVDELADLMMQKGKEVEASIVRLAQLARAAGIHLIIATQRPSVDVVTGLIKANFPSRIAFQVTSGIDSRTILDTVGAEALLGKGDMLFKPRAGALQRMHGAFVTDEEVRAVVDFWKKDRKVEYTVDFTQYGTQPTENVFGENDDHDPMFDAILERIMEMEEVSISMLQRQFKLGFGRAGRIMDQLERDGIVGPPSGSKPRKVLR